MYAYHLPCTFMYTYVTVRVEYSYIYSMSYRSTLHGYFNTTYTQIPSYTRTECRAYC